MFQGKKTWATAVLLAMALGSSACGAKNSDATGASKDKVVAEELAPEYTYVAKYFDLPEGNSGYYNSFVSGNEVYNLDYLADEEGNYSQQVMKSVLADGKLSDPETVYSFERDWNVNGICVDGQKNIYVIVQIRPEIPEDAVFDDAFYANFEKNSKCVLTKIDARGQVVFEVDLKEFAEDGHPFYLQRFVVDSAGRSYVYVSDLGILLFDANGDKAGTVEVGRQDVWISCLGTSKDGKVYASYMQYDGNGETCVLAEVDFEGKKLGKTYLNFNGGDYGEGSIQPGRVKDILSFDRNGVYEYSLEKEESVKILTWLDCDVDGSTVSNLFYNADGKLYAFVRDFDTGSARLAEMTKVRTEDVVKRETLTFGVLYGDSVLSRRIVEFNQSSDQYRITVKTYLDANDWSETSYDDAVARLMSDLVAGNGPDLFDLNSLDVENLVKKGVIENLMPYLEKSSTLSKEDFFDRLLEVSTYDGVLAYVPAGFALETLAAKTSLVGDGMGWSFSDVMELAKGHPRAELMEYANKELILRMMMILNKRHFIDAAKGECHFDTEEFKAVLNFANAFPMEEEHKGRLAPFKLADNSLLLEQASIYSFEEVQSTLALFGGENVTFIGYPSFEKGNGCLLFLNGCYGISSKCDNKEAAWSFLEFMIQEDDEWSMMGFSSRKSQFEARKQKALEVNYVYDENGEILTDANGGPIYENGGSWSMEDDEGNVWEYHYRPVTQEEADLVERLLEGATPVTLSEDAELNNVIFEEAQSFFQGSKSADEVAGILQNRINLYLKENQ